MILQDANQVNKNGNVYSEECLRKAVKDKSEVFTCTLEEFELNNWQEVTKEEIYNAMLMPGEYKEEDGKFYIKPGMLDGLICDEICQEEVKAVMVNNTIDLFPADPDFDIKEPKIDWVMDQPTDYDKIIEAKKVLREAFDSDEQFKWGYIHSVTMHLHDELCKDNVELKINRRNEIAEKMLKVIFYLGE